VRKKEITPAQYQQLLGLKVLAIKHNRMLEDIKQGVIEILSLGDDDSGHADDFVWDENIDVDYLLKTRLQVKVARRPRRKKS
jgi:hypothetical protein